MYVPRCGVGHPVPHHVQTHQQHRSMPQGGQKQAKNGKNPQNGSKKKNGEAKQKGVGPSRVHKPGCLGTAACTYLCCLTNPFDGPVCGLPAGAADGYPKTRKMRLWVRGSCGAIASGNGFLCMVPDWFIANDITTTGFVYPVTYTDGTVTKTSISTGIVAGIVGANSNSPFTYANFTTGDLDLSYRIVSAGLRWTNTTAALYRAGTENALFASTGSDLSGDNTSELNAFEDTRRYHGTDKGWRNIIWKPSHPCDFELKDFNDIGTGGDHIYNTPPYSNVTLGVVFNNGTTQAQTYDYEACVVVEFAGAAVGAMGLTPTRIDPLGSAAVLSTVAAAPPQLINHPAGQKVMELAASKMVSESSGVSAVLPWKQDRDWLGEAQTIIESAGAAAVEIASVAALFL